MDIIKDRYTITDLSEYLGITDHALRYYEKEFKIHIPKDGRGRRYYTPELANMMYQIKTMRSEGLEIKAIKKILESENMAGSPPPVVTEEVPVQVIPQRADNNNVRDIRQFFDEFREQVVSSVTSEVASTKEHLTREIYKSKQELGACVENSIRKLETKMEKHFQEVDRSITNWRKRNKGGVFKRIFNRVRGQFN